MVPLVAFLAIAIHLPGAHAADFLWQIGLPDRGNAEFRLAPSGYAQFENDGFFVVGESDPRRDWPYVHPGPIDAWAGSKQHTFTVLFGLRKLGAPGTCQFQVSLLDTHSISPPRMRIQVNGQTFERRLPGGAGDDSVRGSPTKGKEYRFSIEFPADLLKAGDNVVEISSLDGGWFLYDWLGLQTPSGFELSAPGTRTVVDRLEAVPALLERGGKWLQPIECVLHHFGSEAAGLVRVDGVEVLDLRLTNGVQMVEILVPAASREANARVVVEVSKKVLLEKSVLLKPVRKLTVYVLPHSHTDIGYTEIQTTIEKKQVNNLLEGIAAARKTAHYPEGARFVWNVEVLWAADLYLRRLSDQQRSIFFEAVKSGQVALNGMYLNELTGLCRPEELLRLFRYATELGAKCGVPVDSAMISDVPGYTWGTVSAMAEAGIRYFSVAPNYFDRIGDLLVQWENKPFYWVSPSGKEKVLVWIPTKGYALSHLCHKLSASFVVEYLKELETTAYPYDVSYVRWSGHGDNATPDPEICEFIKDWNTKYAYPKFIISSTSTAFRAFEQRYGNQVPQVYGDLTPYWEDGAASSALETAINRATSDRLCQAETLWALLNPPGYPVADFEDAWRNVLLYSEHTWGADCSVSDPENQKTKEQWDIKRSYAMRADSQSRELMSKALHGPTAANPSSTIEVLNTTSWPRDDLAIVPQGLSRAGDRVLDDQGHMVASQRLSDGQLAFLAQAVPPFAARRYSIVKGTPHLAALVNVRPPFLENGLVRVRVDEKLGGIVELLARGRAANFVDNSSGEGINDYLFLAGDKLADIQKIRSVSITVKEPGPLVASLLVESEAPGCRKLSREVRLVAGFDYVELINTVDKERAPINPKPGDWQFAQKGGKESVNFAFPFNVPGGQMELDIPLGAMRPEVDQISGSCKNWFTIGRWVDVANAEDGITWVTLDAPLVEVGGLTATLLGSQKDPKVWLKKVSPTQKLYSWAMNNHWSTNYRAYQEGPTVFRFFLRPHRKSSPDEATRFATGLSQPLVVRSAGVETRSTPRLRVDPCVTVLALKPSDDGKGLMVRLFGSSGKTQTVKPQWDRPEPKAVWLSDTGERRIRPAAEMITVPAWGVVTLRAENFE